MERTLIQEKYTERGSMYSRMPGLKDRYMGTSTLKKESDREREEEKERKRGKRRE